MSPPHSDLTKDAEPPSFHHSKRDTSVTLRSEADRRCGRTLLTGNCLTAVPLALHHLPLCAAQPPPPPHCCVHPVLPLCSKELPHEVFPNISEQSIDYRTQTPALISHLMMPEAAADFQLEGALMFLLDTD